MRGFLLQAGSAPNAQVHPTCSPQAPKEPRRMAREGPRRQLDSGNDWPVVTRKQVDDLQWAPSETILNWELILDAKWVHKVVWSPDLSQPQMHLTDTKVSLEIHMHQLSASGRIFFGDLLCLGWDFAFRPFLMVGFWPFLN